MKAIAIIPSRMAASRLPGKPLLPLHGMPLLSHCYERTKLCFSPADIYIATCDQVIIDHCQSIGANYILTSSDHQRASDRTYEAYVYLRSFLEHKPDIIIMVQGDEPLLDPSLLDQLVDTLRDPLVQIANIMSPISSDADFKNTNTVKVVTDNQFNAVYYSRSPIPCSANPSKQTLYQQTGLIGFKSQALNYLLNLNHLFLKLPSPLI